MAPDCRYSSGSFYYQDGAYKREHGTAHKSGTKYSWLALSVPDDFVPLNPVIHHLPADTKGLCCLTLVPIVLFQCPLKGYKRGLFQEGSLLLVSHVQIVDIVP